MINLLDTGIFLRAPGGNVEHPELHEQVAKWITLNIGGDVGRDPSRWDTQRRINQGRLETFPWLHCHSYADIGYLIATAKQWGSPAIGLNIEDVVSDGLGLESVADIIAELWFGLPVLIPSLCWLQNDQGWDVFEHTAVFALEIFPDEAEEAKHPQDCIDHAFQQIGPHAQVTLCYKTRNHDPHGSDLSIAHSLFAGDDVDPTQKAWGQWVYNLPTHPAQPSSKPPVPKPPKPTPTPGGHNVNVPFKRPLYPPDDPQHRGPSYGVDVTAVKRAISRAGCWRWQEFDQTYSTGFAHGSASNGGGVAAFQKHLGLKPTGFYGKETHQALIEYRIPVGLPHAGEFAFDHSAVLLYTSTGEITPAEKVMAAVYEQLDIKVQKRNCIGYSEGRPIYPVVHRTNPALLTRHDEVFVDCSGDVSWTALMAGAIPPDPVYGYNGYGNTGSLIQGGQRIELEEVSHYVVDHLVLAFYHHPDHVNIVKSPTEVYSDGRENAPEWHSDIVHAHPSYWQTRAYKVA